MFSSRGLYYRTAGVLSGLLLMAGNVYGPLALCGFVGLVPVLAVSKSKGRALRKAQHKQDRREDIVLAAFYAGLGYTLPQMFVLRLPIVITVILLIYLVLLVMAVVLLGVKFVKVSAAWGGLAVGAVWCFVDWVGFTVMPMWGTAQSFGRSMSAYPVLAGFVSFTGIAGAAFLMGGLQGLAVNFIFEKEKRAKILTAAFAVIAVFGAMDLLVYFEEPVGKVKVAAVGWTSGSEYSDVQEEAGFEKMYAGPVREAAKEGAKIIVSPELGFDFGDRHRGMWLRRFGEIARDNGVCLAVGYLDDETLENKCMFISPAGEFLGEHVKMHLTPFENFTKGDGEIVTAESMGVKLSAMICQDDNFTDLSRKCGRAGAQVVAVPTLDWETVKGAHLQSSIHRAMENRYAVVRAAMNGISAIVTAKGEVVASRDHFTEGDGYIVGEVELFNSGTFYNRAGHWFVVFSIFYLVLLAGLARFSKTSASKE